MAEQIGLEGVFSLSDWSKNVGRYQSDLGKMSKATDRASGSFAKSWNQMGATVGKTTAIMGGALVAAGAAATAAIAGFAASGIQKAADLEAQMSNIAAIFNTTADAVKPLGDLILQLGIDPNLKVSTMEAAEAIEMLGKNGLTMQQIMDGAAHSTVLLANATGADFGTAADIATDAMAQFNIDAENMSTAIDGIVSVTNASKLTIDDYRLAIGQAGGVAAGVGVEFDDFNAVLAGTASRFAGGSDGGTSFKTMLQRLIPQSDKAADMMFELGLMTTDYETAAADLSSRLGKEVMPTAQGVQGAWFEMEKQMGTLSDKADENADAFSSWLRIYDQNEFFDKATGDMKDMNDIAILLQEQMGDLTEEQRLNALTTLAGTDAARTMLGLIDLGAVAYTDAALAAKELGVSQEEVNKVIEGGVTEFEALQLTMSQTDAAQQAATRMDNLRGALEILQGVIETVQIRVGQAFIPALTELARAFTKLVEENADQIVAFFQSLSDWLVANLPAAIETFKTVWSGLSTAFTTVKDAIGPIVTAIGNIATGLTDNLWPAITDVNPDLDIFAGALTGIAAVLAAATISAGITAVASALATLITPLGLVILASAGLGIVWNTNWLGMRDKTIEAIDAIKGAFQPLTDAITTFGSSALTEIQNFVTGNETEFTNLQAIWTGAQESFSNVFGGIKTWVTDNLPSWQTTLQEWGAAASQWVTDATAIVSEKMIEWKTAVVDYVANNLETWTTTLAQWTAAAWQWIAAAILVIGEQMATWGTAVLGYVTDNLETWKTNLLSWGNAAWQWIVDAIPLVTTQIGIWGQAVLNYVLNNYETWQANLLSWGMAAWQWLTNVIPIVATTLAEWGGLVLNYVTTNLSTWITNLGEWGSAAWQWLVDAIPSVTTQMGVWGTAILGYVTDNYDTWLTNLGDWTKTAWQWIVDAVPLVSTQIGTWGQTVFNYVDNNLETWEAKFLRWTQAAWQWIVTAIPLVTTEMGKFRDAILDALDKAATEFAKQTAAMETDSSELATALGLLAPAISNVTDSLVDANEGFKGLDFGGVTTEIKELKTTFTGMWDVVKPIVGAIAGINFIFTILNFNILAERIRALPEAAQIMLDEVELILSTFNEGWQGTIGMVKALLEGDWAEAWRQAKIPFIAAWDLITGTLENGWDLIKLGFTTMRDGIVDTFKDNKIVQAVIDAWNTVITETKKIFGIGSPSTVFHTVGKDIIQGLVDGLGAMIQVIKGKIDEIKIEMVKAFVTVKSWIAAGKAIIDGVLKGLREDGQAIIDYILGLGQQALDSITGLFKSESPSKVMMQLGRDIIEGWLIGMRSMSRQLYDATQDIANGVVRIAGQAGAGAINAFTRALQSFNSIGILNRINLKDEEGNFLLSGAGAATGAIQQQQEQLEFLKVQADLVEAIRESGADPADVLKGVTLGPNANPVKMAEVIARTMERLNQGLVQSLQAAMSNAQGVVDFLRDNRESITDIEEKFTREHLSTLDRYKDRLAQLDEDLAEREARAIATGRLDAMADVRKLDAMRQTLAEQLETLLDQRNQMAALMEQIPTSTVTRGRDAIEAFRERFITPLAESFETATIEGRANILDAIAGYKDTIRLFAQSIPRIVAAEEHALRAAEGFGEGVQVRINAMLTGLYNPANLGQQNVLIADLRTFASSLNQIRSEIERRGRGRESGQSIIEQLTAGPKDLLGTFEDTIASIDARIERAQADALATGNAMILNNIRLLDSERDVTTQRLQDLLNLRRNRRSIEDIEERFTNNQLTTMERFAQELENIDQRIANAERSALTGDTGAMSQLAQLDRDRGALLARVESFLATQNQVDEIQNRLNAVLASQPVSDNQRGQQAIERWRETMIDPLIAGLESLSIAGRNNRLQEIERRMRLIQGFAQQLPSLTGAEERLMQALEGFGTGARNQAEKLLALVYDPRMASVAAGRAQAVHNFANSLINLRGELERLAGRRLSKEDMMERIFGSFDQLTAYQNALDAVDQQIAAAEAAVMETGNTRGLDRIRMLDERRAKRQEELENFLRQTKALEDIMKQVKNFSGPGQASAERFFQEHVQVIADAFSFPMRSVERDAWIRAASDRVGMINRFIDQMRALEKVQNRVAGNQAFAHLADEFAQVQDILMPEQTRASLISQLDSYITQMMRLHQIQQDISVGRGVNPLVERFASERLDAVVRQLENINLSEAERNRLIEQYRMEQEKILALQQKQQQLDFINQQLALVKQLRDLDDKEGWSINVESILSGIGLGMNASIDDLMRLTARVLDELVRFANHELGIASPSKVFAKVGMNLMAGLESGIMAGMRQPMNALRSAAGNLVPYSLQQRALNINMGGVTINDGMDAVMFEAKMRQIVRSEFAA